MDPTPGYGRRLAYLLADEFYGPKLARLSHQDAAAVLELVNLGQGRAARAEIVRLDEQRRRTESERRLFRLRTQVRRHLADTLDISERQVILGVSLMTSAQLRQSLAMDDDEIRAYADDPDNIQDYPELNDSHNPWWYH